jgi:hypothetical protein
MKHEVRWMHVVFTAALLASAGVARGQELQQEIEIEAPPTLMIHGEALDPGTFTVQAGAPGEPGPVMVQAGPGGERGATAVDEGGAFFENHIELLGFGGGLHGGKVVKGAPFSAVATSETTQTLADGNHINRKTQTNLYRDSLGRFRKEVTLPSIGPLAASGKLHSFIEISDPVAGTNYVLEPEQKVARQAPGPIGMQVRTKGGPGGGNVFYRNFKESQDAEAKTESLGVETISGVNAEGTRTTRTIAAGEIGNEKPITIVSERWYSPDLQMDVKSTHSDPRFGNTSYTLTNIQRTEPAATLFAVPAGYSIEQGHRGRFMVSGPPPPPDN